MSSFPSKIENHHILHKSIKIKTGTQDKALLIPNVYSFLQDRCYPISDEFFLSFPLLFLKMVCKTILTICLNSIAPTYSAVWASNVNCIFVLAVQTLYQWQIRAL